MLISSGEIWQTLADLERKVAPLDRPSVKFVADAAGTTEVPVSAAETTAAPRASLTPSQRAWRSNFLLGAVVGAFLPGVSLAVLITLYAFDSGQSGLIWDAFLLGILVGTAFTATVILDLSLDLVLLKDTIE